MSALRRVWMFLTGQRLWILALALLVLLPVFAAPKVLLPGSTYAWLFVIDITESMNVRDVDARMPNESRLDRAKASVVAALANLPCGSTAAVALFAGTDTVTLFEPLEVCAHFPAIEQAVRNIDWRMAWDGDSRIEAALVAAIGEAGKRHLDLVFVTDGDEAPHVDVPRLGDLLAVRGPVHGWLLGVGSPEPHPVPRLDAENRIVGYWTAIDAARQGFHPNLVETIEHASAEELEKSDALDDVVEHRSALRAAYLKQLGTAAGLGYETAESDVTLAKLAVDAKLRREQDAERDVRFVFGLAAALLLLIDRVSIGRASRARSVGGHNLTPWPQ
ncbi:MAG TPA: vWA domain-containing protein [Rhodanobacteraceae bacterium]|nr:vWA domain-containing protein [Rhodanobacteraceae bacterium]